jgi:hypothetical protein
MKKLTLDEVVEFQTELIDRFFSGHFHSVTPIIEADGFHAVILFTVSGDEDYIPLLKQADAYLAGRTFGKQIITAITLL